MQELKDNLHFVFRSKLPQKVGKTFNFLFKMKPSCSQLIPVKDQKVIAVKLKLTYFILYSRVQTFVFKRTNNTTN